MKKIRIWVMLSSWLIWKAGEILNKKQSSTQTRCIKIVICNNEIVCNTIPSVEKDEMIHILECCLKQLRNEASQNVVPIRKEK